MNKKQNQMPSEVFPVIKYDYSGKLLSSNGAATSLLGQWKCRNGGRIPSAIMNAYPEMSLALKDQKPAACCIALGEYDIMFDIIPFPEAGYVGMYGYSVVERITRKETPVLRLAG